MSHEFDFLKIIKKFPSVSGIGDDCALEQVRGGKLLVSTDLLVEGTHFPMGEKRWDLVGQKAITVNVSDIYASGGKPKSVYIGLSLPRISSNLAPLTKGSCPQKGTEGFTPDNMQFLYKGLDTACQYFGVKIRGGDITATTGPVVISITVTGEPLGKPILRSGAQVGDRVFVSGALGGAAATSYELFDRYYRLIEPRKILQLLRTKGITSMADVSDGLARCLYDIGAESKVGFEIDEELLPLAPGSTLEQALSGGEDYCLVFTVADKHASKFARYCEIGRVVAGKKITLVNGKIHRSLSSTGYDQFH